MNAILAPLPTDSLHLNRVVTPADWDDVLALRYAALLRQGDIAQSPQRRYADVLDTEVHVHTLLLRRNDRPEASTRVVEGTTGQRSSVPAMAVYARDVEGRFGENATFLEMDLTVVDSASGEPRAALIHLFRGVLAYAALRRAAWIVTAVRDDQIGSYARLFGMQMLSPLQPVPGFATPRALLGLEVEPQRPMLERRMPELATSGPDLADFAITGRLRIRPPGVAPRPQR